MKGQNLFFIFLILIAITGMFLFLKGANISLEAGWTDKEVLQTANFLTGTQSGIVEYCSNFDADIYSKVQIFKADGGLNSVIISSTYKTCANNKAGFIIEWSGGTMLFTAQFLKVAGESVVIPPNDFINLPTKNINTEMILWFIAGILGIVALFMILKRR